MKSQKVEQQKRLIQQNNINIECYYYNYFKSPGLNSYPQLSWVNDDYNLIKQPTISEEECLRLATNLFIVGQKYNLFNGVDYFIMMPKKPTSVSSLEVIINQLVKMISDKLNIKIEFLDNIFYIENYRKFWQNKLKVSERQAEIANKIHLLVKYENYFTNKWIIIIDDVVSSGTSIAQVITTLWDNNHNFNVKALCYGSVYNWQEIYE
ncbi:phosphoribosyltransferase [Spiroplasma sp. AdecLV25b]|uniref:phosphoribosyltransferase n=1 Tax=Spiroplasma sp. AdecLV25b TaxID=3027162 RepID=UPI0027DFAB30|nr:phosphoribosyltransferase [Spiroplasma sp. AdecLV25b]